MKIEDVFGDYQNGNFNTNTNTNINKKTKLEDTLGYKSVNNGGNNTNNYNSYGSTGKKGSGKTGLIVVFSVIAVMIVLISLYLTTDFLKGPKQLLAKYTLNLAMRLSTLTPLSAEIATTESSATEVSGDVTLRIEGNLGEEEQNYDAKVVTKTIEEANDSEIVITTNLLGEEIDLSLIKSDNLYAIGSSKLVLPDSFMGKHYVALRNEDLRGFVKQLMPASQMANYIPDQIDFSGLENIFTEEEVEEIKTRYSEIVLSKITDESLTVEKKVPVMVDGQEIIAKKLYIKIDYSVLEDILVESLETLKTDKLLLESYKRVIDIQIDETKITSVIDKMKEGITKGSKENEGAYLILSMYAADNETVAVEFGFMKNEETPVATLKMEVFDGGLAFEAYTEQTETVPSSTSRSVIRVVSSDISETIDIVNNITYDIDGFENLNSWEDYYREEYKDTKTSCSYEITSYKKDVGYKDELKVTTDEYSLKYKGNVAYNAAIELTTLTEDNAVVINDLNLLQFMELFAALESITGGEEEEYPPYGETDPMLDDPFTEEEPVYDPFAEEDPYVEDDPVIDVPAEEPNTIDELDALATETDNAIKTCEAEAAKYEEYFLKDFLNVDNITMLCPVVESTTLKSETDTDIVFEITTISGVKYELSVGLSGDSSTWRSINRTSF